MVVPSSHGRNKSGRHYLNSIKIGIRIRRAPRSKKCQDQDHLDLERASSEIEENRVFHLKSLENSQPSTTQYWPWLGHSSQPPSRKITHFPQTWQHTRHRQPFGWLLKRPAFSKISQPGYTLQWCHRRQQRKRPPTRWGRWSHAWNLPPFQLPNNKLVPGPMLLTPFPCKFWKFLYLLEWFVYIFLFTLENFMGELVLPQIQGNVRTEASTSHKICNFIGLWKTGQ